MTARTAALVLQARNVTLGDVHQARSVIEPAAVRILAASARRKSVDELKALVEEQREVLDDPEAFGQANARFHERLVGLAGNQTLSIVAEMLNEIVARAVTAVSQAETAPRLARHPAARHPLAGTAHRADRDRGEHRRRGALARPHGCRRQGDDRPEAKSVIDLLDHY